MALENYFDFAENDYKYFIESYENGTIANMMGNRTRDLRKIYETSHCAAAVKKCREEILQIQKGFEG